MLASLPEAGSAIYVSVRGKPAEAVPGVARDGTLMNNWTIGAHDQDLKSCGTVRDPIKEVIGEKRSKKRR